MFTLQFKPEVWTRNVRGGFWRSHEFPQGYMLLLSPAGEDSKEGRDAQKPGLEQSAWTLGSSRIEGWKLGKLKAPKKGK